MYIKFVNGLDGLTKIFEESKLLPRRHLEERQDSDNVGKKFLGGFSFLQGQELVFAGEAGKSERKQWIPVLAVFLAQMPTR